VAETVTEKGGSRTGRKKADDALVFALSAGASAAGAARHAGVSERTVYRRLADPAFRARVDAARSEMVQQVVGRLAAVGTIASQTLQELLGSESEAIRLGAARAALDFMFRGHEQDVLARRIAALEEQATQDREGQE
jgi:hypothetical protein